MNTTDTTTAARDAHAARDAAAARLTAEHHAGRADHHAAEGKRHATATRRAAIAAVRAARAGDVPKATQHAGNAARIAQHATAEAAATATHTRDTLTHAQLAGMLNPAEAAAADRLTVDALKAGKLATAAAEEAELQAHAASAAVGAYLTAADYVTEAD